MAASAEQPSLAPAPRLPLLIQISYRDGFHFASMVVEDWNMLEWLSSLSRMRSRSNSSNGRDWFGMKIFEGAYSDSLTRPLQLPEVRFCRSRSLAS